MSRVAAILTVVAVGQTFALVVGGFDLSVAANMSFTGTVAALTATHGHSLALAVAVAIACGTLIGLANGLLIAKAGVTPFVTTLGMLTLLLGLGNQISHGQSIYGLPESFGAIGRNDWGPVPSAVVIANGAGSISSPLEVGARLLAYPAWSFSDTKCWPSPCAGRSQD